MSNLLTVKNIFKTYQKAVSNVSFEVNSGDIVAFLGPNGAGKTSTLKMILNLIIPDQGQIFFQGQDVTHKNLPLLKNTGVLLEGSKNMFWSLSPIENFIYWGGQRGLNKKEATEKGLFLLKRFNLLVMQQCLFMTNMLKQLASHGIGILVTTHQLDFAQKVANKILLINHGQLVFSGNVKASLARLNQRTVFEVQFSRKITTAEKEKVMSYCIVGI